MGECYLDGEEEVGEGVYSWRMAVMVLLRLSLSVLYILVLFGYRPSRLLYQSLILVGLATLPD